MWALNLLVFLKSKAGQYLLGALAVLALLTGLYTLGHHNGVTSEKAAESRRLDAARKAIAKREVKAQAITEHVAADLTKTRTEIVYRTRTLIEKVPTYVPQSADAGCSIPRGFLRLYDAAATGLPSPSGGPDQTPSGIPLSRVLETDVANLGVGYDYRAEVIAWRGWYSAQKAAFDHR